MTVKIGIIGYGMVGKTIHAGFRDVEVSIVDPLYTTTTLEDVCLDTSIAAIFVCVPTPANEPTFTTLTSTLNLIVSTGFAGLVVVKSTVLPQYLAGYDVIFNPEFLSRATALDDLINPPYVVVSGNRSSELISLYERHTDMDLSKVYYVDLPTAAFIKYTANAMYALKVTFMNEMFDVAAEMGANYGAATDILKTNLMFGNNHVTVPGTDGKRGFGGPCLPKDAESLVRHFQIELLDKALELNARLRS